MLDGHSSHTNSPALLVVPNRYIENYRNAFDSNGRFYGGYFTLTGFDDDEEQEGVSAGDELTKGYLRYVVNEDVTSVTVIGYTTDLPTEVIIPETIRDGAYTVTAIATEAFINRTTITKVVIPKTVTLIGDRAFKVCAGLIHIYVHSTTIINIMANVFEGTHADRVLYVPGGMKPGYVNHGVWPTVFPIIRYIPGSEFVENGLRYRVNEDGETATLLCFDGNPTGELDIPETVSDGELTVTSIVTEAFINCTTLTKVIIPRTVTLIGDRAFHGCTNLVYIAIQSTTVINITANVFGNIGSGAVLYVPVSMRQGYVTNGTWSSLFPVVRYIPGSEFVENGLRYRVNDDGETASVIGYTDDVPEELTIPEAVTGDLSVTTIAREAFLDCTKIKRVVIPASITCIEDRAFAYCINIVSITVYSRTIVTINANVFEGVPNTAVLYVPDGSADDYSQSTGWSRFSQIKEGAAGDYAHVTLASEHATFCSDKALDFTNVEGLKAYIASGFSPSTGELLLTRVMKVPAGEGLLLKGDLGSYDIPYAETDMFYVNLLKGVTEPTTISPTEGGYTNFILARGSYGIGFYTLSQTGEIAAGKAYLQIPSSAVKARVMRIVFDDDDEGGTVTAIDETLGNPEDVQVYDMQGRRVESSIFNVQSSMLKKGLYIVNGKKVFIK